MSTGPTTHNHKIHKNIQSKAMEALYDEATSFEERKLILKKYTEVEVQEK